MAPIDPTRSAPPAHAVDAHAPVLPVGGTRTGMPPGELLRPGSEDVYPAPRSSSPATRRATRAVQFFGLALVAYTFLFNLSVVRGSSMAPNIADGDRILIDHLSYWFGEVERGDIVVMKYPLDPSVDYIKRVVGLPGDEILIDRGRVWINGEVLPEPYVGEVDFSTHMYDRVRPAHFFVLGDNRKRSSDSREFGQVPQDYVRGKVELRVWPLSRFGAIQ